MVNSGKTARTAAAGRAPQSRNRRPSCPLPGLEQEHWGKQQLPASRQAAGKARAATGGTYLCASQTDGGVGGASLELRSRVKESLQERGRAAGRNLHRGCAGGVEEVCLHPRQRGWAAGAWWRGVLRDNKKTALRVREGRGDVGGETQGWEGGGGAG